VGAQHDALARSVATEAQKEISMNAYTDEQISDMATDVRDCAWPPDVKEYMVMIEPMLRAWLTERQAAREGVTECGEPIDLPWITSALGWIENDDSFSRVTRRIAAGQRAALEAAAPTLREMSSKPGASSIGQSWIAHLANAYRDGFILACRWPEPVSQDVDSPAFRTEAERWLGQQAPHYTVPEAAFGEDPASATVKLERWGFPDGISQPSRRCDDGYWTPWHIAQKALNALAAQRCAVPDGWALVPEKISISSEAFDIAQMVFGGPGSNEGETFYDCTAWFGECTQDDGVTVYGLHLSCDECPEEGSVTLAEFNAAPHPKTRLD